MPRRARRNPIQKGGECLADGSSSASPSGVRIVIVEDHLLFGEVLRKVCTDDLRHEVVGEAGDGERAVEIIASLAPDLVLLDLHLPKLDGFGVLDAIRQAAPRLKVLVLSSHCDEYTVYRAERARVQGFVDKNTNTIATLQQAITTVETGRVWFSEAFRKAKAARHENPNSFDKVLGDRERDVLVQIGALLPIPEIARRLGLSSETVEKHRSNLLKKLNLASTADLARYARERGFNLSSSSAPGGSLLP